MDKNNLCKSNSDRMNEQQLHLFFDTNHTKLYYKWKPFIDGIWFTKQSHVLDLLDQEYKKQMENPPNPDAIYLSLMHSK